MRAEVNGDELLVTIDAAELPFSASTRNLKAKLPGSAPDIASEITGILAEPGPPKEPTVIRAVTVRVTETRTIASETLLLAEEKQVFA